MSRAPTSATGSATALGLGRFARGASLGGGKSGQVFRAKDSQGGAEVALKIVQAEVFPSGVALERAQRELRQLARVSSPLIPRVIDFGKTPEGVLYVASELAEGVPLDRVVVQGGALPVGRARAIVLQIGEALAEAQKAGVIHRDVAPKNVLVDANDRVRIINFSIPRPLSDKVFGVPEFLSPEQAEGKPVDQRSNIYSLGAIFYYLLTGQPPFAGADAQAICEMHLKTPVPPPSTRRAGLPPEIDRVVLKALEKSSSRRHLTLRQLLSDIEAIADNETHPAHRAGAQQSDVGHAKTLFAAGGVGGLGAPGTGAAPAGPAAPAPPVSPASGSKSSPPMAHMATMAASGTLGSNTAGSGRGARPETTPPRTSSHGASHMAPPVAPPPVAPTPASRMAPPVASAPPMAAPPMPAPPVAPPSGAPPQAAAPAGSPLPSSGGGFRETLWFKKGDVEQFMAQQQQAAPQGAPAQEAPAEDIRPLEDRYVDDGTVSHEDREKFSLRTGATMFQAAAPAARTPNFVPGERMSEREMMAEIQTGRKIGRWVTLAVVILAALGLWMLFGHNRGSPKASGSPTAAPALAVSPPAMPAVPTPPPILPTPTAAPSRSVAEGRAPQPAAVPAPRAERVPPASEGRELLARASKAADRGHLVGSSTAAVELFLAAQEVGTPDSDARRVRAHLLKLLEAKAKRDLHRKDWPEAHTSYSAIVKLDPEDRAARLALRDVAKRVKR